MNATLTPTPSPKEATMSNKTSIYRPHQEVTKGEIVTTYSDCSIGIGYLQPDGEVFVTTGSCYAKNAKNDIQPMVRFECDNGAGYRSEVRRIVGW